MDKIRTLKYLGEESYKYSKEILGNNGKVWFDFHFDKFFKVCDLGLVGERCIEVISVGKDKDIAQFLREATERLRNAGANSVVIDAFNCETMYFDMMANESYTDEKSLSGKQEKKKEDILLPELPDNLNTDDAKKMFEKAVKAGLMQPLKDKGGYQWNKGNALLAYFCGKIYCGDRLKQDDVTKELVIKRGGVFFPEAALNSFFLNNKGENIKNLGQSRLQILRPPKGYKDIDNLFDEATD